jgi:hypothetical protein
MLGPAKLAVLEPVIIINKLHFAVFAVFIFHFQINNTYRDPERYLYLSVREEPSHGASTNSFVLKICPTFACATLHLSSEEFLKSCKLHCILDRGLYLMFNHQGRRVLTTTNPSHPTVVSSVYSSGFV